MKTIETQGLIITIKKNVKVRGKKLSEPPINWLLVMIDKPKVYF